MVAYRNSSAALKTSIILVISAFILVLYSTFLNRSGVLGNASVHSFTDLGLSGQLLVYMLTFLVGAIAFAWFRWKDLPKDEKEIGVYSKEFWIFVGASILGLSAFQLTFTTSIPVYNTIAEAFGLVSNLALPADQAEHYSKIQIWIFVAVAVLSAVGQYVWWGKIKESTKWKPLLNAVLIASLLTVLFVNLGKIYTASYIVLLWSSLFSTIANGTILWFLIKQKFSLSGGAMAHVGLAIMLIGVLFSSGYSKVVSLNRSGFAISNKVEEFTKDNNKENKENLPLWLGQGAQMQDYLVTYKGRKIAIRGKSGYYNKKDFEIIEGDFHAVALRDVTQDGESIAKKGDTLTVEPENNYYELEFKNAEGKVVSLYPRWQVNPKMGTAISPDVKHAWGHDIYTYVSLDPRLAAEAGEEKQWSQTINSKVSIGDTLFLNDFVAVLKDVSRVTNVEGVILSETDAAVQANFLVLGKNFQQFDLKPTFIIKDGMVAMPAFESEETGIKIKFTAIDPKTQQFSFAVNTTQQDLIIIKALEKPYINLVWVGSILMFIGLFVATFRRTEKNIA
jgi:cytochrome c-type biogenesis protein CcmF